MPSPVTVTFPFLANAEGFAATEGTVVWESGDGSPATGCLKNAGTVAGGNLGSHGSTGVGDANGQAHAALTGLTWVTWGVPATASVVSVRFRAMMNHVAFTGGPDDIGNIWVTLESGGNSLFTGTSSANFVGWSRTAQITSGSGWVSSDALSSDGAFLAPLAIQEAYQLGTTAFDLRIAFQYYTGFSSLAPITVDCRLDTLELTIEYVDLNVELTETLVLIVADPAGIISDPALPPAGGTGAPIRFDDGGFTDDCGPENAAATVCTRTSRTLPVALATHLAGTALTLAYCLKLVRRDGEVFGFTTHDHDLTFGGTTYETLNSLAVTALRQELGGSVGNLDLSGLIRSDRVTAADLLAGRYDGAEITLALVNWSSLGDGSVTLARGWFGAVQLVDGQWQAEYRGIAQRLQQEIVRVTSPLCDVAQLGDDRCKVNLAPFQFSRTVASVSSTREMAFSGDSHGSGYFSHGRVIFTSGENDGLDREIKTHTHSGSTAVIVLQLGFPFLIAPGDTATLEAGCDRRLTTCQSRFSNVVNNRSFPHVPGYNVLRKIKGLRVVG